MKRTGKILGGLILLVLLLLVAALWYVGSNLDSIVATIIEKQGSQATGTRVEVEAVKIDIRGGSGRIAGLSVANPDGFSGDPAISFGELQLRMDPLAVTADPIVIEEISVSGAEVLLEQTLDGNNLRTLQENLTGDTTEKEDAGATPVIIERFVLRESSVEVRVPQLSESRSVTIPQVVVTEIGRASNGATASEVARQVLEPIIRRALESAAAGSVEDAVRDRVDETRERLEEGLRQRFGQPDDDQDGNEG